ncbi:hypothetical protein R1flu_002163 [Riccia fluitans]|uniref:Uncharacterized protein n=1 Tax=Riccia fluitans TaxID=41844 RepID=A0ABD1Y5B7_9MARC
MYNIFRRLLSSESCSIAWPLMNVIVPCHLSANASTSLIEDSRLGTIRFEIPPVRSSSTMQDGLFLLGSTAGVEAFAGAGQGGGVSLLGGLLDGSGVVNNRGSDVEASEGSDGYR